jgi:hypothetical protein
VPLTTHTHPPPVHPLTPPPLSRQVMEECLNHHKEFRRLVLLVTWLELLRERDLWLLRDEVDGLVRACVRACVRPPLSVDAYVCTYINAPHANNASMRSGRRLPPPLNNTTPPTTTYHHRLETYRPPIPPPSSPPTTSHTQEGYEMWPTTCQREGALALDPDYPYHAGQGGGLAPVDERQDLLLLERVWR